jgi:hypothetical protein
MAEWFSGGVVVNGTKIHYHCTVSCDSDFLYPQRNVRLRR